MWLYFYFFFCFLALLYTLVFLESSSKIHFEHWVCVVKCIEMINSLTATNSSHTAKQAFVYVVFLFLDQYPVFMMLWERVRTFSVAFRSFLFFFFFKPLFYILNIPYVFFCSHQQKHTRTWSPHWRGTPKSLSYTRSTQTWSRKWGTSTTASNACVNWATRASLKTAVSEGKTTRGLCIHQNGCIADVTRVIWDVLLHWKEVLGKEKGRILHPASNTHLTL